MLGAPQAIGMIARKQMRLAAVAPSKPLKARLPVDPSAIAPCNAQDPADPLDHHRPGLGKAGRHQADAQTGTGTGQ